MRKENQQDSGADLASARLTLRPEWTFRAPDVAADFDRHVREQLPWYDLATGVIAHIGRHYLTPGGLAYDLGASTGNIGRALAPTLDGRGASLVAVEAAQEMAARYAGPGRLVVADAREVEFRPCDLIVAFLVLMFMPITDRAALLDRAKAAIRPGGAVVVFDKLLPVRGYVGTVLSRLTLAAKYEAGATPDEIIRKELSLAGVQRPMSEAELHGFTPIFRFGDFAGFVYERE